ncbi:MAG: immunity 7 family protein [Rickettsiales bacterium]|nr:immunity 7 family protein [Rickettsiales bacterium]
MLEYNGWVTIRESYNEENESTALLELISSEIASECTSLNQEMGTEVFNFRYINGSARLFVIGAANHNASDLKIVINFFEKLSKKAPGSYGILSYFDDEDNDGYSNEMQIFVLKKGTFSREKDTLLSPRIPIIEDI